MSHSPETPDSKAPDPATNIIGLRGLPIAGAPVQNVVDILTNLLERAKTGDIRAVAYAIVRRDGTVGAGWEKPDDGLGGVAVSMECHGLGNAVLSLATRYGTASWEDGNGP